MRPTAAVSDREDPEFEALSTDAFGRDGKLAAVNSCIDRQAARCQRFGVDLWDETTHRLLSQIQRGLVGSAAVAFSPDSRLLAIGGCRQATGSEFEDGCKDGQIVLWEVGNGQARGISLSMPGNRFTTLAFSSDGTLLASGGCATLDSWSYESSIVRLWEVGTGMPHGGDLLLDNNFKISNLTFAPGGKSLVIAGCSEHVMLEETRLCHATEVRILSVEPLGQVGSGLVNESGWIKALAVSGDGRTLAVGSAEFGEGSVVLWDLPDRERLGSSLRGQIGDMLGLAWMPDGLLEARGLEATLLWRADPGSWRDRACAVANRNLTCPEWQRYLAGQPYRATCPNLPEPACGAN
jgi:WD40 repeat protein